MQDKPRSVYREVLGVAGQAQSIESGGGQVFPRAVVSGDDPDLAQGHCDNNWSICHL